MVTIISKQSGPRREDVALRRMIDGNRPTIERLADQISHGQYSAGKRARAAARKRAEEAAAAGGGMSKAARRPSAETAKPYLNISLNGRVVIVDFETGRQMHFLGTLAAPQGMRMFLLATAENGFGASLEPELAGKLQALNRRVIDDAFDEDRLEAEIASALGLR